MSQSELAEQIGEEQVTISRNELGKTGFSQKLLEMVYSYAFGKNVKINKLKFPTEFFNQSLIIAV